MSLVVCLFLQLLFSAFWSDAQLTSDEDSGEDYNSNLEDTEQPVEEIDESEEQENSPNGNINPCPDGFIYNENVGQLNKCYAVVLQGMDWNAAQAKCRDLNPEAQLVIIESPLENQIISEMLQDLDCQGSHYGNNWFWTGGRRRNSKCSSPLEWKSNPSNDQAIDYADWCPDEPHCSHGTQHCVTFAKNCYSNKDISGWQDDTCSNDECPICELRIE